MDQELQHPSGECNGARSTSRNTGENASSKLPRVTTHAHSLADGSVISTDLVDRGYGEARRDFLFERAALAPNIVTNPPYIISLEFVRHAVSLAPAKVAMLLRLSWLEGGARGAFFSQHPPARVWVSSKRITIHRSDVSAEGGGMMAYAWFVWEAGVTDTRLGWINPA
jgi:hypothetical protein